MNEEIKKFLVKVVIVVVAVLVLYFTMSPYQNCLRFGGEPGKCLITIHKSYD